ncbi:S8 family serine peptidase [Minwuia sp.]|uniref:S8 family serine peptidase n=1 Tax=Minwuia sp. TaxID=2493630 RepID=UPI003A904AF5
MKTDNETDATEPLAAAPFVLPDDPLLGSQFNLNNTGQTGGTPGIDLNVFPVWDDYRGSGVTVGVIDDGVEHTHPDLIANYDTSIDNDSRDGDSDALAIGDDRHGTAVAGIIAADDNGFGSVGVAPDATIAGFRMGFGADGTLGQITENMQLQVNVDISNNSWGFGGFFGDNFKSFAFQAHADALETTIETGRDGLGTVWVFAAGNSRGSGDDVNYHSFQNSRHTIAVAAAEDDGDITFYSTPGAAVITTAPVAAGGGLGGVITTDRQGAAGYSGSFQGGDFTSGFNGTSAATPMVSGVIALMLEANASLGYRDVQEILAYSSRQIDAGDSGWTINDAADWNGGGLHVSHDFGFGLVDAHAAVRLAESWTKQSVAQNEAAISAARTPFLAIQNNATVSDSITITDPIDLQWVEIDINIDHTYIGDLVIELTAPDGTSSVLVNRPGKSSSNTWGTSQDDINFVLTSARHWGEDATGVWTLSVSDHFAADVGTLISWELTLYGDVLTGDDDYIYTDEYGTFAAGDAGRRELADAGGNDRINAAALTAAALIDLNAAAAGTLAGQGFSIAEGTEIEHAISGDGDDTLIGNALANDLNGARGDDVLTGGAGDDTLTGGAGADTFRFGSDQGIDTITDFDVTADRIELDGIAGITDRDSFVAAGRQAGDNFLIAFEAGGGLSLLDVLADALTEDVFSFLNVPEPVGPLSFSGSEFADDIVGTIFADTLKGGAGADTIRGDEADDTLLGQAGDDLVEGDAGADRLSGGTGQDTIRGGDGEDVITGEDGNDFLEGGADRDTIYGDAGDDTLRGDAGIDRLTGGDGSDNVLGGADDDLLLGNAGRDTLKGDGGNDEIYGGVDDDTVMGLGGDDFLRGDDGNDRVAGGDGADLVFGGAGDDVLSGDGGTDTITSGIGDDRSYGGDGSDLLFGDDGRDTLLGGADGDLIEGGAGDDSLLGEAGNDTVNGDAGADTARGGAGDDQLNGGAGDDTLLGDDGDDTLSGEADADRLAGGSGNDSVLGGSGDDVLTGEAGQDTIRGGDGDDLIIGGDDTDILLGDTGDDRLLGSGGNDRLVGGSGADRLEGGSGNDVITGGDGIDRFVFADSDGPASHDTITDFTLDEDVLDLSGLAIASLSTENLNSDSVLDTRILFDNGSVVDLLGVAVSTEQDLF